MLCPLIKTLLAVLQGANVCCVLCGVVCLFCPRPEEREEAQRNVVAMRRVQSMYMPETRADALVDEKQKVQCGAVAVCSSGIGSFARSCTGAVIRTGSNAHQVCVV